MPRSFRFEHFTVQKPTVSRKLANKDKQRLSASEQERAGFDANLHYGRRHAETEELAKARARAESHEKIGRAASQGNGQPPARATPAKQESKAVRDVPRLEQAIDAGFTPAVPEPQLGKALPEATNEANSARNLFDVLEEGRQQVEVLARCALEFGRAGVRLAQLSVELARMAAKVALPRPR